MKNKAFKNTYLFIKVGFYLAILLVLANCSGNSKKTRQNTLDIIDQMVDSIEIPAITEGVIYRMPSPIDLFIFLEAKDAPFINEYLHDPACIQDYATQKSQALNFGVYSADLVYSSVFGDIQQTLIYFNAAKILASNLGLHEGYGQNMALRIDQNLNNVDSLIEITADSYNAAVLFLEEQGLNELMGIIMAGGWIESLYLAIHSLPQASIESPIIERIVDQQILLDNLLAQLHKFETNSDVKEVIRKLEELQEIYDKLYFNDEDTLITKQQLIEISNKVTDIRASFIK